MRFSKKILPLSLVAILLTAACTRTSRLAFDYRELPAAGWNRADSLCFDIDSVASDGDYALRVGLRTSMARPYPFTALTLQIDVCLGDSMLTDTLTLAVADEHGALKGTGVAHRQQTFPAQLLRLRAGQSGRVVVRHLMEQTPLIGVESIGVEIEAADLS